MRLLLQLLGQFYPSVITSRLANVAAARGSYQVCFVQKYLEECLG